MTARTPVYIDSGKLHVFEDGDTLPPWLSPSSMAWENLTGVPAGLTELAALTGPGYAKLDSAGAWSVQAAIPQADVSGLATTLAGLQPVSARLTAIAGLTDSAGWLHDDGAGNWAITTPTASQVGAESALGSPSTSGYLLSSNSAGVRSWVAPYSLPVATASVLGGVKVGAGLSISLGALSVAYGTAAGTACVGNDSRLSDSRTPTAHALDGALHTISGKTAGQALVATGATTFGFATISGDATLSGSGALTLATLLTAGSAGSATSVPVLTWDTKGRLNAAGSAAISISHTQINDWGTYINQPLLTTSSPTFVNVTANLIGSASGLGGVGSDYFVQGNGIGDWGHRTTVLAGSAAFTQGLQSGFFDNDVAGVTPNNSWAFLINSAHSSSFSANQYQFQIAASFDNSNSNNFGGEGYWVRVVNQPGGVGAWRTLLHSGNVGNYAIPLTGSSAITGPLVSSSTATFSSAAIANGVYRSYTNDTTVGAIYGSSLVPSGQNYTLAWNQNGNGAYLNGTTSSNLFVNNVAVLSATATGITAYQPITGSLIGHASLDIPLTGSSAITGALVSSSTATFVSGAQAPISISGWNGLSGKTFIGNINASVANGLVFFSDALQVHGVNGIDVKAGGVAGMSFYPTNIVAYLPVSFNGVVTANNGLQTTTHAALGSATYPWGIVHANVISNAPPDDGSYFDLRNTTLKLYKYVSQGNTFTSTIEGTGSGLLLSSTAISGTFTPAVNSPSTAYTISSSDQGKMVVSNNQLNLPLTGISKGFWCLVNWHVGGGGVKFGPASGTAWYFRGTGITTLTSEPFTGIVSWDGYTWYAG